MLNKIALKDFGVISSTDSFASFPPQTQAHFINIVLMTTSDLISLSTDAASCWTTVISIARHWEMYCRLPMMSQLKISRNKAPPTELAWARWIERGPSPRIRKAQEWLCTLPSYRLVGSRKFIETGRTTRNYAGSVHACAKGTVTTCWRSSPCFCCHLLSDGRSRVLELRGESCVWRGSALRVRSRTLE